MNLNHNRTLLLVVLNLVFTLGVTAQEFQFRVHDTDGIPPQVHAERRLRLATSLPAGSVALIVSADVRNRQNDVDYEYRQNSDMLYLTGFPFPYCALLLCSEPIVVGGVPTREIFFVRERNVKREVWQGVSAGPTEARLQYGMPVSLAMEMLVPMLDSLLDTTLATTGQSAPTSQQRMGTVRHNRSKLFLSGYATRSVPLPMLGSNLYVDIEIKKALAAKYGRIEVTSPIPHLAGMREVKDTAELRLIRKAVDITVEGHLHAMANARPSMHEYEIEALIEYYFKKLGAEDVGYPSIVGSSYNSCVLHYTANRRMGSTGDLVLADCGAEYHGYTADVTRTFPLSGKFSPDQLTIYNIVLEAQDSGIAACRSGNEFADPHKAARAVITHRLLDLGIIKTAEDVTTYFMHGTSHYLGLDVHDAGTRGRLQPNTVITVEPGVYIPEGSACDKKWWNIGVRIEDDVLITTSQPENLSVRLPRKAAEIELLMSGKDG